MEFGDSPSMASPAEKLNSDQLSISNQYIKSVYQFQGHTHTHQDNSEGPTRKPFTPEPTVRAKLILYIQAAIPFSADQYLHIPQVNL